MCLISRHIACHLQKLTITFYVTSHPLHSTAHHTSSKHGPPCLYYKIGACALKSHGEGSDWKTRTGNKHTPAYDADICVVVHTDFVCFYFPHVFLLVVTFCVVMLCHWSSSLWRFDESYSFRLQNPAVREELEMSVTSRPTTKHHITRCVHLQRHRWQKL
jgi:hypothetical protein